MQLNHWTKFFMREDIKNILMEISENLRLHNNKTIFPAKENMFRAFNLCDIPNTKVVILGQDPYHGENQATGLSFSVPVDQKLPPSLQNIFKELKSDLGITNTSGDLTKWAQQGVLLLNSVLTVNKQEPASHKNVGWEKFTDRVIKYLSEEKNNLVFILWGNFAISKKNIIDNINSTKTISTQHLILTSSHPSPFSAHKGFFGSKPFSKTNQFLNSKNIPCINWAN
jgi:uracil-DNA glycosylase